MNYPCNLWYVAAFDRLKPVGLPEMDSGRGQAMANT
jgi:hypothetical protein